MLNNKDNFLENIITFYNYKNNNLNYFIFLSKIINIKILLLNIT